MQRVLLATLLLCFALAGCSDAPPSGGFTTDRHNLEGFTGTAQFEYQERVRPGEGLPVEDTACVPDDVPDPTGQGRCIDPHTNVTGTFLGLPDPGADGYTLRLNSSAGGTPLPVGALTQNATVEGAYDLPKVTFEENHADTYDTLELLAGDVLVATAGTAAGPNSFMLNPDLTAPTATGEWRGKELTVTVAGAQPGVAYTGHLYTEDGAGVLTQAESFPISGDGEHTYEATQNIDRFAEFHVHVAGTAINVAQATIE